MVNYDIFNLLNSIVNGSNFRVFKFLLPSIHLLFGRLYMLRLEVECCLNRRLEWNPGHVQMVVLGIMNISVTIFLVVRKFGWFLVWKSLVDIEMLNFDRPELLLIILLLNPGRPGNVDSRDRLWRAPKSLRKRPRWLRVRDALFLHQIVSHLLFSVCLL